MLRFSTTIQKFDNQGEKTGWTYIALPAALAQKLKPGNKKSFRVKGRLDDFEYESMALLPMGDGDFILALNATIRKKIKKQKGAIIHVEMQVDEQEFQPPADFIDCLKDEPLASEFYYSLSPGHQRYFARWIDEAKTESTKTKRLAMAVNALAAKKDFGSMIREQKEKKEFLK